MSKYGMDKYGFGNAYYGDNVPCDVPGPQDIEVEHRCINSHTWEVILDEELGGWFYYHEETDPICPFCGERYTDRYRT